MPGEIDRTARGQIQLSLGDRGVALERIVQTNARFRYVGWYVQPTRPLCDRPDCEFCTAARNGRPVYVGYHRRDALERIGVYKHEHAQAEAAA